TAPTGLNENDQYLYDNEGNRVLTRSSTTTNGATTSSDTITFDNLTEVDIAAGVTTVTNYYNVSGQRVAMRKGAILSYLVPDFLGSDSVALNADGTVQAVQLLVMEACRRCNCMRRMEPRATAWGRCRPPTILRGSV